MELGRTILDAINTDIEGNVPSSLPFFATTLPAHETPLSSKHIFSGGQNDAQGRVAKMVALLASKIIAPEGGDGDQSAALTRPPFDELRFE